ncbi:hypothetical protein A3D55_02090 [Candidatus Jorgensenbacteria bacterium RIFCSPHIGHO2_02_FULL_45_20]|uniref:DUF4878 domain-containing protein n=2 Tax=Candidatus Joergenseniibacteriota TaxID=1752739 RepID=A0A1F6BMZ8_9BACT|nr:MAG: hypothetical protein UX22_C0019G0003 [Candidatus Jorgensenbacteria bacterium GW2011_GWA2_45_9]OGG38305.1 MAG: hypothetical protein A3D55_02090 [Candidatus Jorgensenbacteria bacterium RIFCSPHIGHO2_02_FULL_45_20]
MTHFPPTQEEGVFFNPPSENKKQTPSRKRVFKFVLIAAGAVILMFAVAVVWEAFFSARAVSERESKKNYEIAMNGLKEFEDKMRADTYGGKTPQETLDMFITVLETGDVELASKYFSFDTGGLNAFSREKWTQALIEKQQKGEITKIILFLKNAKQIGYIKSYSWYKKGFNFETKDENNQTINVTLVFNHLSGVWKIESM